MAFSKDQFKNLIERVLEGANVYSEAAVNLLLGTAAQESKFGTYLKQIKGPALSAFQIEPATFTYLRNRYDDRFPYIMDRDASELEWDLKLAILIARLKYLSIKKPLPDANDLPGLAAYWKQYYNTPAGAGTTEQFIDNYHKYVRS